ncbi:TetR/AcrR family transcriptional regulator [Labrys monachus]|uniref:AcrR family transcriptional regulator n=1 Tax=Labrys monachus TaxID=217067 RepID=A0ABU0FJ57_9HYPH|nr:TetR/AcrR family transcriptional regulator [Labrys monachus]MDQ0394645.1 AcrR family transcriptional regulator [Labrys monachus]
MARKPQSDLQSEPQADPRRAAVEALLALAAERPWGEIGLADIAEKADLSLSQLRGLFPSKGAILAAYSRQVDQAVLDGIDETMAEEPARERLFDVLMRRIDVLSPRKAAIREISKAFALDPLALAAWNRVATNSMQWMLVAAGIGAEGPLGALRAQGLALAWSRIVRVWLRDEDEGSALTMKEVDRQLRSGERWMERADDLCQMFTPLRRMAERSHRRRSRMRERLRERFHDFADTRRRGRDEPDDAEAI